MDVYDLISTLEERYGNRTAIIDNGKEIDCRSVKINSYTLANALYKLGLKKGDKIAIYLTNRVEYVYIYFACYLTGIIVVPIDFYLSDTEIINIINHCKIKYIFTEESPRCNISKVVNSCDSLKGVISVDDKPQNISFNKLIEEKIENFKKVEIDPDDYSSIFYTSGSTGKPKGVLWNYRHIHIGADALEYFLNGYLLDQRAIASIPLSHSGGILFPMGMLKLGLSIVLQRKFNPIEFLRLIDKWKINSFWIVPPMWYALLYLKDIAQFNLSSVKLSVVFGAPSDPDLIRRSNKYFQNAEIWTGWGMTEVIPPTTVCKLGEPGKVGKPYPWVTLKIADENGLEKKAGEIGELCAKGEGVFLGYYNEPELTAELFKDGWFKTGDLAYVDKQGYYYLVGRSKDMLKVGGEIVWCAEVELTLMKHPCVKEASIIGIHDKLRGEVPVAYIILKEGIVLPEKYIIEYASEHLAKFKIPKKVIYVKELPKTGVGKIDKAKLKELYAEIA
jgi:acyl-CoA synthetase (AMP-forming)/AMP-acid ligase II